MSSGVGVTVITWSVLALEFVLAAAVFATARLRLVLLPFAVGFHFGIIVFHGLSSFFLSMAGALLLYLWPVGEHLRLRVVEKVLRGPPQAEEEVAVASSGAFAQ